MLTQPLVIGSTYRLKFKSTFERHGVCTTPGVTCLHQGGGVFRLEQITNFKDLILEGVELYDVFFKPLGISEDEYHKYFDGKPDDILTPEYVKKTVDNETTDQVTETDVNGHLIVVDKKVVTRHEIEVLSGKSILKKHYKDKVDYASYPLYKFVDVIDENDVLWVPELTIDGFPEIDIREYKDLSLVVHLGYLHSTENIDPMLLSIRERMAIYGWRPKQIKLYVTDSKWMSPSEYDKIKQLRVPAVIETITPETRNDNLGKMVICPDGLKQLVSHVEDPTSEIDIDAVKTHPVVLDWRLFQVQCQDGEVFVTGDNYYVEVERANPLSSEDFREAELEDFVKTFKDDVTYFEKKTSVVPTYEETKDLIPSDRKVYYVQNEDESYREAGETDFNRSFADGKTYYELDGEQMKPTPDTERNPSKTYYIGSPRIFKCKKLLKEGIDYNPGDPCTTYKLATLDIPSSVQRYEKEDGGYLAVPYGHHADYALEKLLIRKIMAARYTEVDIYKVERNFEEQYYVQVGDGRYREATEADFKQQFKRGLVYYEKMLPTPGVSLEWAIKYHGTLYYKDGEDYIESTDAVVQEGREYYYLQDGVYIKLVQWFTASTDTHCRTDKTYYILIQGSGVFRLATATAFLWFRPQLKYFTLDDSSTYYRAATVEEIANPALVLYTKQPDRYIAVEGELDPTKHYYIRVSEVKNGKVYTKIWKENYATVDALQYMGFKFDYDDTFGQPKTITLQLEDIIEAASTAANAVLPDATFDYDTFWKKYDGRKFQWTETNDPNDPTQLETLETIVSRETKDYLSVKAGRILGQSGQISKEMYVKADGIQERNYYMRYLILEKQLGDKSTRIQALEQALVSKQKENDDLRRRVAELEALNP